MRFNVVLLLGIGFMGCGGDRPGNDAQRVIELGKPATYDWPASISCPSYLSAVCSRSDLVLVGTVNLGREVVVNTATVGTNAHVICRWPVGEAKSCERIGSRGATVKEEVGIYGTRT